MIGDENEEQRCTNTYRAPYQTESQKCTKPYNHYGTCSWLENTTQKTPTDGPERMFGFDLHLTEKQLLNDECVSKAVADFASAVARQAKKLKEQQ